MNKAALSTGIAAVFIVCGAGAYFVAAQPMTASTPASPKIPKGQGFDFYVLALSWSPTYCQSDDAGRRDQIQCQGPRPFAFVVHGLWPQFERGFPRACRTRHTGPNSAAVDGMLDIMPSPRLVQHQWQMHGSCSGLSGRDYLSVTRAARAGVNIPQQFARASDWMQVKAGDVEAAFIAANPDMAESGISVTQRGNLLSEVRICLTLDLKPRPCREVDERGARPNQRLAMPPSRG